MIDTKDFLKTLSDKWSAKHSDDSDRIERGLEIAQSGKVAPQDGETFKVVGSKGAEYIIKTNEGYPSCTCPDHTLHQGRRCKHIWACALMTRLAAELEAALAKLKPSAPIAPAACPNLVLRKRRGPVAVRF